MLRLTIPWLLLLPLTVLPAAGQPTSGVDPEVVVGAPAGPPVAGEALDALTEAVSSKMRCPVCQGLSVADSPTVAAMNMKAEVRQLLAEGFSREQVMRYFEQSYGEFIRLEPKAEGFNLVVWVLPVFGLLVGAAVIAVWNRSRRRTAGGTVEEDLESYRERVRREVRA